MQGSIFSSSWLTKLKSVFKTDAIGDVRTSFLTLAQFQAQMDSTWVLCDGQAVIGSEYESITGQSNIPDLRGRFLRGKDHGATGVNPDGDLALGSAQSDAFASHQHGNVLQSVGGVGPVDSGGGSSELDFTGATGSAGGNETRPKNVTVNYFIKIDA